MLGNYLSTTISNSTWNTSIVNEETRSIHIDQKWAMSIYQVSKFDKLLHSKFTIKPTTRHDVTDELCVPILLLPGVLEY